MALIRVTETVEGTGEIITSQLKELREFKTSEGETHIHKTSKRQRGLEYTRGQKFNFFKDNSTKILMEKLTARDIGYLVMLSTYEDYDGVLFFTPRAKQPMGITEVRRALQLSRNAVAKQIVTRLIDLGAIEKVTVEKYDSGKKENFEYEGLRISTDFFLRGKLPRNQRGFATKQIFDGIRAVYTSNGAAETGWLSLLFPFLDPETNFIIRNPDKLGTEEPVAMSMRDIAEVTGVTTGLVSSRVNTMKIVGYSVWEISTIDGGNTKYRLNPLVANKLSGDSYETLLKSFTIRSSEKV